MNKLILTAATIAAFCTSPVFAGGSLFGGINAGSAADEDDTGAIYGGLSIGQSTDSTCNTVKDQAGVILSDIDCPTPRAWKILAGYQVAPNLGVEGAYIDFGKSSSDGVIPVIPGINNVANPASLTSQATGLAVAGVATAPVTNDVNVFGKAGVMKWEKEMTATVQSLGVNATTITQKSKTDGVDLSLGAGAEYKINDNWGVRGELEHFDGLNANLYSIGATFSTF